MRITMYLLVAMLTASITQAQDNDKERKRYNITLDNKGISVNDENKPKKDDDDDKAFEMDYFMLDLGFNTLMDNSNYNSAAAQSFIDTSGGLPYSDDVFSLRSGKSINVNIYPVMARIQMLKTGGQKIYMATGVGLQLYNFRFNKNISYRDEPQAHVIMDSINFRKNKLAFAYVTVPLGFTFKTRLAEKAWLVYGFGAMGGFRVDSWTKQVSAERGKDKNHDKFNFNDFNACITGEFGIDGYFRLFASYQVTPLHENTLEQYPLSIGFRFGGI